MVIEHAILPVKSEDRSAFLEAFSEARAFIEMSPDFQRLELLPSVDIEGGFLLLVHWASVESHQVGFRGSDHYAKWRALLHHFYPCLTTVTYFQVLA